MPLYLRIRRLRGPAFLILFGITALLQQWHVLRFSRSWPLYLIMAGLFGLAERAALTATPLPGVPYVPGAPFAAYGSGGPVPPYAAPALSAGTEIAGTPDSGGRR